MDEVLNTYIYEIKKGTKPLALITVGTNDSELYLNKIKKNNLCYFVSNINHKSNIFFGLPECVAVAKSFLDKPLYNLSAQEDFILGIILGYNRVEQCKRYLNKLNLHLIG